MVEVQYIGHSQECMGMKGMRVNKSKRAGSAHTHTHTHFLSLLSSMYIQLRLTYSLEPTQCSMSWLPMQRLFSACKERLRKVSFWLGLEVQVSSVEVELSSRSKFQQVRLKRGVPICTMARCGGASWPDLCRCKGVAGQRRNCTHRRKTLHFIRLRCNDGW